MEAKRTLQQKILALRAKSKSYREIAQMLHIAKSTVSYWAANDRTSQMVKDNLTERNRLRSKERIKHVIAAQRKRWDAYHASAIKEAQTSFQELHAQPLFVAGLMLYWGEGDSKPKNALRLSNTSPALIAIFVRFLREIMRIPAEKIKLELILYPDLSDKACKDFWTVITQLPAHHFFKTQYIRGRHPTKRLAHGICMVIVNDRFQKAKLLAWIDFFAQQYTMLKSKSAAGIV